LFPPRPYFLFHASNPLSLSHRPLFHYSPLILSATIPVLHLCYSTYFSSKSFFTLQSLSFSYSLITIFFLNFSPLSIGHSFLFCFFLFASKFRF
jgi:hypothetical protein